MIVPAMKTISVLGSLGAQGSSVVNSFLKDGSFRVRGIASSIESPEAKELAKRGVEMMAGNVKEPSSLVSAFTGADVAFIVVNFWDPEIMTKERDITKAVMDEAKKAGVKHVIYSSLANVKQISGGKYIADHFTLKAEAFDYLKTLDFEAITAIEAAAYYSNWFKISKPVEQEDGTLVWTVPGKGEAYSHFDPITGTGPSVLEAAKNPVKYNGQHILLESETLTPEQAVSMISKALGKPGLVKYVDQHVYSTFFPGADEIADMCGWFDEYGYYGPETEARKHSSGKEIGAFMTFQEWLDGGHYKQFL